MKRSVLCALFATLAACATSSPLHDESVAIDAVEVAWDEAPLPSSGDCLEGVEVTRHASKSEYVSACEGMSPGAGGRAAAEQSAGCLTHASRGLIDRVPVIHVAPGFEGDLALVQHEALHALIACTLERPDVYDGAHSDPRIWTSAGGPESVQSVALSYLAIRRDAGRFSGAGPTARG